MKSPGHGRYAEMERITMGSLKNFEDAFALANVSTDTPKLEQLSEDVNKVMHLHGFTSVGCHTECRIELVIGPSGRPEARLVCTLICPRH
jgi:hypothetical protein